MSNAARPKAPDHLTDEALLEWHRVCDELADAGRLDVADRAVMTLYVETWAIYQDMMRHVRQHGAIVKHHNGVAGQSPFYKTSREVLTQLRGLLTDLGLTPMARSKVKAPEKEPAENDKF